MKKILYISLIIICFSLLINGSKKPIKFDKYFVNNWKGDGWEKVPEILNRIKSPVFPNVDYNIMSFKAVADGKTDCRQAIMKAIDTCSKKGGGRVIIPKGDYFVKGPINLKSNVNLHLEEGAYVKFGTDTDDYLPVVLTRWEGVECMNYSPLIYAYGQENIAITGKGVFDGQANSKAWWPWKGTWKGTVDNGYKEGMPNQINARNKLFEMGENNAPINKRVFGKGSYLRPNMVQPYRCKNILIEDVIFINSPMWYIHPVFCSNVTIQNVSIFGHGPNNDGCNPDSCKDVLIKNCFFDTGDDCIAVNSSRDNDGRRVNVPSENIIIQDCIMKEGHGGIVVGSGMSGGAKNIFAENCKMDSPDLWYALKIKTNLLRGGTVEEVYVRNIEIGQISYAVLQINMLFENVESGNHIPTIKNIQTSNMRVKKTNSILRLKGLSDSPITNLRIENSIFNVSNDDPFEISNTKNIIFDNVTINNKLYQTKGIDK